MQPLGSGRPSSPLSYLLTPASDKKRQSWHRMDVAQLTLRIWCELNTGQGRKVGSPLE